MYRQVLLILLATGFKFTYFFFMINNPRYFFGLQLLIFIWVRFLRRKHLMNVFRAFAFHHQEYLDFSLLFISLFFIIIFIYYFFYAKGITQSVTKL